MELEELSAWLTLNRVVMRTKGMTPELIGELKERLAEAGSAVELLGLARDRNKSEVFGRILPELRGFSQHAKVEREAALLEESGVSLLTVSDKEYPTRLASIFAPPLVLYVAGRLESPAGVSIFDQRLPAVAVVGTRRASHYGIEMAEAIGRGLASSGIIVASGMARGCDTAAHRGALSVGGLTMAVLGTGVDMVYPAENKRLYEEIKESGLVLSEFPMGTAPLPMNFPLRNRIISGLSLAVVVVEAPLRSGAMMTARMALEEGREVFALPGHAGSRKGSGTNKLIKDGAVLVESAEDIIKALSSDQLGAGAGQRQTKKRPDLNNNPEQPRLFSEQAPEARQSTEKATVQPAASLAGNGKEEGLEGLVIGFLDDGPLHIDSIVEKTGIAVQRLTGLLLDMELKGLVAQKPGKLFIKKIQAGSSQ